MVSPMDKVKVDLEATQSYLAKSSSVGVSTGTHVMEQQCESWAHRLACMKMDPTDAASLVDVLGQGPWTEGQKAKLLASINGAVLNGGKLASTRRPLQSCDNFKAFLSVEDLKTLGNPSASMVAKIDCICIRMLRIGLHCPAETCWQKVIAVAQGAGLGFPNTPKEINNGLKEMKRVLKGKAKIVDKPAVHIVGFPHLPSDLPKEIIEKAFDGQGPPCGLDTEVADLQTVPLRMSNKLIRGDSQQQLQLVPHGGAFSDAMNQTMNMMMMQQQMLMRQNMGQAQNQTDFTELPGFQIFKPKRKEQETPVTSGVLAVPSVPEKANQVEDQHSTKAKEQDLKTPPPRSSCLHLPEVTPPPLQVTTDETMSAAEQAAVVSGALQDRKSEKEKAKSAQAKGKAKAKAKAKGKPKAVAKSSVQKKANSTKAASKPSVDVKPSKPLVVFSVNGKKLTPEFRMSQKPHGCGKCRYRPGCTPSCWKDRKF